MGHTIYYNTEIRRWEDFKKFLKRIARGLGYSLLPEKEWIILVPDSDGVEPLKIKKSGAHSAKTYLREPYHSIYLLILYSASAFGSVEVWED
ncbi:MAG: hypothetical protein PWQ79_615 [Thermococcaceae archaeon]|nr:hypothetical protein [Thermococcaceae archaeon]MDK2913700.1 hypothetical protein [Thermococcaceae archaeon]